MTTGGLRLVSDHTVEVPKETATGIEEIVEVHGEILTEADMVIGPIVEVHHGEIVTGTGPTTMTMIDGVATVTMTDIGTADVGSRSP